MDGFSSRSVGLIASLAIGLFVVAPFAHADSQPNGQELGITESVLHFCGKYDPDAAHKLSEKISQLVKGSTPETLARTRSGVEYQKAYNLVAGTVGKLDDNAAKQACTETSKQSQ